MACHGGDYKIFEKMVGCTRTLTHNRAKITVRRPFAPIALTLGAANLGRIRTTTDASPWRTCIASA